MKIPRHSRHDQNIGDLERALSIAAGSWLALGALRRPRKPNWLLTAGGVELLRRGATGYCPMYQLFGVSTYSRGGYQRNASLQYTQGILIDVSEEIRRPVREVYEYFRELENLPRVMSNLVSVTPTSAIRSRWVAKGPAGKTVEWDAEIINEEPNELIGWRSLEGSTVQNAGSVRFSQTEDGQGTKLRVRLQFNPPGGIAGAAVSSVLGANPESQIREDLKRLKERLESEESRTESVAPLYPEPIPGL